MRFSNEIKAGLVIVIAAAIGVMFFGKTAKFKGETYEMKTVFTYGGNLQPDAIVKLSGIEVGRLTSIDFVYEAGTKVECILEIDAKARIRKDSIAYIDTAGFVGDAYIGITPGSSEEFSDPGSVIASEDPIQMRLLMKKADDIANNLDGILVEVKSVVVDNRQKMDSIVTNIESTTENFKEFSADIKQHPWKILFKGD
ncbi:MAG: MlaD family protein [Candidatus Omnitrophota bacterium]